MSKTQEPMAAPGASTAAPISFEDRDFTTAQTQQILSCGKTTLFLKILPELEREGYVYWEGTRRKINGRGILAYRDVNAQSHGESARLSIFPT
jgi:hypothetical protein